MEISAANLTALFTGFDVVFQRGFEKPPSYYEQITSVVRSASRQTTYPWLGRTTKFRELLRAAIFSPCLMRAGATVESAAGDAS